MEGMKVCRVLRKYSLYHEDSHGAAMRMSSADPGGVVDLFTAFVLRPHLPQVAPRLWLRLAGKRKQNEPWEILDSSDLGLMTPWWPRRTFLSLPGGLQHLLPLEGSGLLWGLPALHSSLSIFFWAKFLHHVQCHLAICFSEDWTVTGTRAMYLWEMRI